MSDFEYLFSPIRIGHMNVRNRIFQPAHITGFAEKGLPTDRLLHYYEARARGGVGLIVQEATSVSPYSQYHSEVFAQAYRDEIVPILKRIGEAVHAHSAKIVLQLWHCGHVSTSFYTGYPGQSSSGIPNPMIGECPVAMDEDDIREAVRLFVEASLRAKEAGYDGVELNFGHGYLQQQFLSPSQNIRTDEYGGSLENRLRFGMDVISAIRKAAGPNFVVGLRAAGDEFIPEGFDLEDAKEAFSAWARTGLLDYLNVTAASYKSGAYAVPPMMIPPRPMVYLAAEIKQLVDLPVFTAIRINDPVTADDIIKNNEADMVGIARGMICDPDLPRKAQEGRLDDIRQCIACNEGCWDRFCHKEAITCLQNPEAGFERKRKIQPAAVRKKVLVVGGGCAGMEAAIVARSRGHEVILCEKSGELGGAIRIMAMAPSRQEFGQAVRFLKHELERLSIDVRMNTEVTVDMALAEKPDAVIVATGGLAIEDPAPEKVGPGSSIEISPGFHVVTAEDVLQRKVECGKRVVIADYQNYTKGLVAAEVLAELGKEVTVIMPFPVRLFTSNPYNVELITLGLQFMMLKSKGVTRVSDHQVKKAFPGKVVIRDVFTEQERELPADTLVLSYWRKANDGLYAELKGKVGQLRKIGDALAPRLLIDAIHEGYKVASEI
ncbi:MAG: FAD-dependent oxidoreductase [Deltaproteobacteria bacterium]|nr:FAD-dependent oxidoreductase [Deltaproteobacteria bacterium]